MRNGTTVKEIKSLWEDDSHNLLYNDQYVMRCLSFEPTVGTLTIELDDGSRHEVNPHQIMIETTEETLKKEHNARIESGELIVLYRRCPGPCGGREKRFELPADKVQAWRDGALIQKVFPELSIADRETLISGMCSECFDEMFCEPDERIANEYEN